MMLGSLLSWLALAPARAQDPAEPPADDRPMAIPVPEQAPAEPTPAPPAEVAVPEGPRAVLRGTVAELGSAAPVEGAHVQVLGLQGEVLAEASTDAQGAFSLTAPPGTWAVRVLHDDYSPLNFQERLSEREALEVRYRLRAPAHDEEMVVTAERAREELSRQTYSGEELSRIPGSFGDPVRALQSLPGVARPQGVEGDIVVRGAEGINTGFYVDEMPVPFLFHMLVGKSLVNPAFIDDVEFYAGGMPSRFGEVTQAAVNVRTTVDPPEGRTRVIDANLLDLSLSIESQVGDWTLRGALRNSWVSALIGLYAGVEVVRAGGRFAQAEYPTLSYGDLLLSAQRPGSQGTTWSIALLGARDTLGLHEPRDYDGDGQPDPTLQDELDLPYDPNQLIHADFARLRLRRQSVQGSRRSDSWIAGGPATQQNLLGDLFTTTEGPVYGRVRGWSLLGRHEERLLLSVSDTLILGGSFTGTRVEAQDYTAALSGEEIPTTDDTQINLGLYAEDQWRPEGWLISPGIRGSLTRFNDQTWIEPEPRLNLRRALSDSTAIKAFVGRFTQMPPIERYAQGIGNPDLQLMTAWQSAVGAEWTRGPLSLDSSVYGSLMYHLAVRDTEVRFVSDEYGTDVEELPVFRDVNGSAYGVEALLRLRPKGPLWGWAALTVGRSLRVDPETGDRWPGDYDEPFALTLLGAWSAPRQWELSGRLRLTSGQPFTPLLGVYEPAYDEYVAYQGELNADRFPFFRQLDLRAEKTWEKRRADWSLYLDIYNTTWAKNPIAATYDYDYSELVPVVYIPLIPSLGLEVKF